MPPLLSLLLDFFFFFFLSFSFFSFLDLVSLRLAGFFQRRKLKKLHTQQRVALAFVELLQSAASDTKRDVDNPPTHKHSSELTLSHAFRTSFSEIFRSGESVEMTRVCTSSPMGSARVMMKSGTSLLCRSPMSSNSPPKSSLTSRSGVMRPRSSSRKTPSCWLTTTFRRMRKAEDCPHRRP